MRQEKLTPEEIKIRGRILQASVFRERFHLPVNAEHDQFKKNTSEEV